MTRTLLIGCWAGAVAFGLSAASLAQDSTAPQTIAPPAMGGGFWGGMPMMGFGAATAAESGMMGMASVINAAGQANLMNSAAAVNIEAARSQYIDNRLKGTKTYFEMRRHNREYRDATRRPRPTSEQLFRLAKDSTPRQLAADQLDPVSGQIAWPKALMLDEFATYRSELEGLFAERANASGRLTLPQMNQVRDTTQQMRELLRAKISDMPPQVFSQSNAFLRQLEHAAQRAG
ncbi:MAG: hypothetical protein MUF48_07515 [Pirellulaceae bacterium]|jgi:hypothetical protein|nr:hypothetical protein [Pirellulaceae bacterium]